MKKLVVIITIAVSSFFGFSQDAFDKYENSENVGSVVINKGLLGIVANMSAHDKDKETKEFLELAKSIDNIRVFVSEDTEASTDMSVTLKKYVKKASLEELMRIKDGDTNVKFYVKTGRNADRVSELLMFVTGIEENTGKKGQSNFETVLVTMTGDIDLNKVGSLTSKMNLPKHLQHAKSGK